MILSIINAIVNVIEMRLNIKSQINFSCWLYYYRDSFGVSLLTSMIIATVIIIY